MITKVIIYNEENREERDNKGETQKIELNGKQFSYVVRESLTFGELFRYLNLCNDWDTVKQTKA
jgi:hypothetical protein